MRFDVQGVVIETSPDSVVAFIGDGANLPRWAIGFAASVAADADGWVVSTGSGEQIPTRLEASSAVGTVDFVMQPAPGVEARAWSRVVAAPGGSLFTFTQVQAPGMPDELFDAQVAAVRHELVALKALLEISCPL